MSELTEKIAYLSDFMLPERFEGIKKTLDNRTKYMTVCLENIFHPQNASAIIRSCEAFGVQELHAIETLTKFSPNVNIVRGTDKWVHIRKYHKGENPTATLISQLKTEGYRIVATSPHQGGTTPETFDVSAGKFALFFGTEKQGISDTVIEMADEFIQVPMFGFVESLNVSVCAAIILYRLSLRLRESSVNWQLTEQEKESLLFQWTTDSIKDAKNILKRFSQSE